MGSESDTAVKSGEPNLPLKSLGKYLIERKLGQGGMGTVYLAKHSDLKKLVALKILPQDKAKNPILVRRFKAEAQAAGQLEHPNIVSVFDTGEIDGYLYIAMEYVEGIDLFEQVKIRGPIPVKRSIEIIKQVAAALQHASDHNIVHRDIKPSNLLLRKDGVVKVTDLGLARSIDDTLETNITRAGTTVGTVDYMAPEQARSSKAADIRSDIYSLGCTWYQMLTGFPPFSEGSMTNKLQAHAIKPLPDPREINENVPEGLFAVLQRMTEKKPEDRYQTPQELIDDLAKSKLTKAAFSNEIFDDLSDHEIDVAGNFDEDEEPDDDESPPSKPASRKQSSNDRGGSDELLNRPIRKKNQSQDEEQEIDVPLSDSPRRKGHSRVEQAEVDDDDLPSERPLRKLPKKDEETIPIEESQPLRARQKLTPKPNHDDLDQDPGTSVKRHGFDSHEEDSGESTISKRKRPSSGSSDKKTPTSKISKGVPSKEANDNHTEKKGPKPLPPKRQVVVEEEENIEKINPDVFKYGAIAIAVLAVIGGLGWLIASWSSQVESTNNPFAQKSEVANNTVAVATPTPNVNEPPQVTVKETVVESVKSAVPDRHSPGEYDISTLPAWAASELAEPSDLPVITVGTGTSSANHFLNLNDGLQAAAKTSAIVRLVGNGPFRLSSENLGAANKIVITPATPQDQPLIIVEPTESAAVSGIAIERGVLDLRGLHFVLSRSANQNQTASAMISVVDGQLFVRNCSFTATGDSSVGLIALSFTSKQDSQNVPVLDSQLLVDHVTVRGNGLTGVQIGRTAADVVIKDSLLVTGTAPAIDLSGSLVQGLADVVDSKPRRIVRILRSTLCVRKRALELESESGVKPPSTSILFQDSIGSAEGAGNSAVLVSATQWPSVTSTSSGWLTNLSWTSKSSLFIGFERLLDMDKSSFHVEGPDTWQRVWGKKAEAIQFQSIVWQESQFADLSSVLPHDFETAKLPFRDVTTPQGNLPGCIVSQLTVPGVVSQTRMLAIAQRPKLPVAISTPIESKQARKVNLLKEDLGAILNKNDWPDGTVFEATGSGLQMMLPARIKDKSLRIIFRQREGPPLRLQPKNLGDQKANPDLPGLFSVENGKLELQSATLEACQTARNSASPWLIHSKNSSVILRGCQLSGPFQQELEQHAGLINWSTASPQQGAVITEPNFLSVNDSLLMSSGVGIRFQSSAGQLFVQNSILAVRGCCIDLLPMRTETTALPVADLRHVTLSASKAAIRINAATGDESLNSPMRLFIDFCAVVQPLEIKSGDANEATVIDCTGPVIDQKQIELWGNSNGFAKELKFLVRSAGTPPVTSTEQWKATWGESSDFRLLTGSRGVLLLHNLPGKWLNLKPSSFLLNPSSAGATWGDAGRPIGADVRVIDELISGKRNSAEMKSGASTSAAKPGMGSPPPPTKKPNIGF